MDIQVKHDADNSLFYFDLDGKRGELKYEKSNEDTLIYYSTYVDENIRENGYGKQMIRYALNYARENDYQVRPTCPMVAHFMEENSEYNDIKPS